MWWAIRKVGHTDSIQSRHDTTIESLSPQTKVCWSEGDIVADFPLCNKSFNCSYSGHDL